jgi:signal recognition particle receptor subunit beta
LAILDVERNTVVIRIVYDGPPEAGKTTSLRALSASLARPMTTPSQSGERTLFFDWMEYTGGLFEGHQIRCQIVTVPGQAVLAHRRRGLLETADVVVFVSGSSASAVEVTSAYLAEMRATLDRLPGPRVGVILQANKRDLPDAVDLSALRAATPEPGIAVLESVATEGSGVRETFVFAVRLALDRVRELLRLRALSIKAPDVQNSADLLEQLERMESERTSHASLADPSGSMAFSALREVIDAETPETQAPRLSERKGDDVPTPPDEGVPSGMIWPPVDGRVILHEACEARFVPRRTADGDWIGEAGGWRFHSPRQASYADAELGRRGLVEWARLHASGQRWFSSPRAVVLAANGANEWRLWQVVRVEESLRDLLVRGIQDGTPGGFLRRLLDAGRLLFEATESLALAPCRLSLTIDTVGAPGRVPLYVGFLPDPFFARAPRPFSAENRATLLRRELGALASAELRAYGKEHFPSLRSIARLDDPPAVVDAMRDVLADSGLIDAAAAGV